MPKVLLVNDDKDFQYLMRVYLRKKGFQAETIDATDDVIPLVKQTDFEIIIIDMKAETDKGICSEVRQAKPQAKIVLLTDRSVRANETHACKPDIVIQKPFQPEELIEKIAP